MSGGLKGGVTEAAKGGIAGLSGDQVVLKSRVKEAREAVERQCKEYETKGGEELNLEDAAREGALQACRAVLRAFDIMLKP